MAQQTIFFHFHDGSVFETKQINGTYNELFALLEKGKRLNAPFEELDINGNTLNKTVNDIKSVEIRL